MGKKSGMGPFLVGDFIFCYFMGSFFKSLVVAFFAVDVAGSAKSII